MFEQRACQPEEEDRYHQSHHVEVPYVPWDVSILIVFIFVRLGPNMADQKMPCPLIVAAHIYHSAVSTMCY